MAEGYLNHWFPTIISVFGLGFLIGKLTSFDYKVRKTIKERKELQQKKEAYDSKASFYRTWYKRLSATCAVSTLISGASVALYISNTEARGFASKAAIMTASASVLSLIGSRAAYNRHAYYKAQSKDADASLASNAVQLNQALGNGASQTVKSIKV